MSGVKILAILAVIIALVMLISGLSLTNGNSTPHMRQECVSSEAFVLPANETTYRSIALNSSGSYDIIINVADGAIFSVSISVASLDKWINGQFNASWRANENAYSMYGLSGPCRYDQVEVSNDSAPNIQHVVFWNPESFSQEVNFRVYLV